VNDRLVGSKIIGQQFADVVTGKNGKVELDKNGNPVTTPDPRYFQTRPSPTTPPDNAAATTFSNLGPNNLTTEQEIAANVKAYLALSDPTTQPQPPHGSPSMPPTARPRASTQISRWPTARIQAHRIAAIRHLTLRTVDQLIATYTTGRSLGIFGEPGVNVLELNLSTQPHLSEQVGRCQRN